MCFCYFCCWVFCCFVLYFNQIGFVIVILFECFEVVFEIDNVFVKWYIFEYVGFSIFDVYCDDMFDFCLQFYLYVVISGRQIVDIWIELELWVIEVVSIVQCFIDGIYQWVVYDFYCQCYLGVVGYINVFF